VYRTGCRFFNVDQNSRRYSVSTPNSKRILRDETANRQVVLPHSANKKGHPFLSGPFVPFSGRLLISVPVG